jgi:hypothetical protein
LRPPPGARRAAYGGGCPSPHLSRWHVGADHRSSGGLTQCRGWPCDRPPGFVEPPTLAAASSAQSSAQELSHLMPPQVGQLDVEVGDEMPTPHEAARRLARFVDEVRVERVPPLIASPPRQRVRTWGPPPIRPRSSWIAAQPLAHIPTSRAGRGTPQPAVGYRAASQSDFTCAQGNTRRYVFWDLVVEPGGVP